MENYFKIIFRDADNTAGVAKTSSRSCATPGELYDQSKRKGYISGFVGYEVLYGLPGDSKSMLRFSDQSTQVITINNVVRITHLSKSDYEKDNW